jgi:hypothetical protein
MGLGLLVAVLLALAGSAGAAPPPLVVALAWERYQAPNGAGTDHVTYGNGRFAVVGENGSVLASDDGRGWRLVHQEPITRLEGVGAVPGWLASGLHAVAYGGGRFVAVGNPWFLVLTSPDGETWDYSYQWQGERTQGRRELVAVTYGAGRFVAIGNDSGAGFASQIITSVDGRNWTHSEIIEGVTLHAVTHDGTQFVAVGRAVNPQRGVVWTSGDGVTWTPALVDLPPLRSVAYSQGRFVAVSSWPETDLFTSSDGASWERQPVPFDFSVDRVMAAGGFFFLQGVGSSEPTPVAFSKDGLHWVRSEVPVALQSLAVADGELVGAGSGGALLVLRPCGRFIDLPATDGACAAVRELEAAGVIAGYPDGTFRPEAKVSRAEVAKLLTLALGADPRPGAPVPFADAQVHWAAEQGYIQAAVSARILSGYPDGTFRPDAPVTRAEVDKLVAGASGLAEEVGGPRLEPDQQVTRAEAAILLRNLADGER